MKVIKALSRKILGGGCCQTKKQQKDKSKDYSQKEEADKNNIQGQSMELISPLALIQINQPPTRRSSLQVIISDSVLKQEEIKVQFSQEILHESLKLQGYEIQKKVSEKQEQKIILTMVKKNEQELCLKTYWTDDEIQFKQTCLKAENLLQKLSNLNSPFLCHIENTIQHKNKGFFFITFEFEWFIQGNLNQLIEKRKQKGSKIGNKTLFRMITNLIDVLAQLQKLGISHTNIKPENILLSNDGHIKLSDYTDDLMVRKQVNILSVPPTFYAPEKQALLLKMQNYKVEDEQQYYIELCKCDVFSFGLTILNVASLAAVINLNKDQSMIILKLQAIQKLYSDEIIYLI